MLAQIQNGLASATNMVITFVPKLLAFLVVLFTGWLVAKAIQKAMTQPGEHHAQQGRPLPA